MKKIIRGTVLLVIAVGTSVGADERASKFLKQHCIRCHGSEEQKADRRFDTLPSQIRSLNDLERYQEIVDLLNLGEMPPEDEPQPTAEELSLIHI